MDSPSKYPGLRPDIWQAAVGLFDGETARAERWLNNPNFGLGRISPLEYARTEAGAQEVRALIGRIEDGIITYSTAAPDGAGYAAIHQ